MDPLRNKIFPSGLLRPQENQKLCNLLPEKVQSVSTAVVQLYVTKNTTTQKFFIKALTLMIHETGIR